MMFDVFPCLHCCQSNFSTGTTKLYCIVLYWTWGRGEGGGRQGRKQTGVSREILHQSPIIRWQIRPCDSTGTVRRQNIIVTQRTLGVNSSLLRHVRIVTRSAQPACDITDTLPSKVCYAKCRPQTNTSLHRLPCCCCFLWQLKIFAAKHFTEVVWYCMLHSFIRRQNLRTVMYCDLDNTGSDRVH